MDTVRSGLVLLLFELSSSDETKVQSSVVQGGTGSRGASFCAGLIDVVSAHHTTVVWWSVLVMLLLVCSINCSILRHCCTPSSLRDILL